MSTQFIQPRGSTVGILEDGKTIDQKFNEIYASTKIVYGPAAGILTTNTPAVNTTILNALNAIGGISLYLPAGTYPFDIFVTKGLAEVTGAGKNATVITLTGTTSPVMVQPGPIRHRGLWFKSVAGSLELSRIGMADYAVFEKCKITDFVHNSTATPPAPNAWGAYFKNVKGCRLYHVEFSNNSQSDIAILEGCSDIIVEGCFHTTSNLVVNFEPNVGTAEMTGMVLRSMPISKLYLQCNDLTAAPDNVVLVEGCVVNELYYDGLGTTFLNTKINGFVNATDRLNRIYGSQVTGLRVASKDLISDPTLSNVGHTGSGCPWALKYSSAAAASRYGRATTGELIIGVGGVAAATNITSGDIACEASTPYLFTVCKQVESGGTRPNIISVSFKDSTGTLIDTATYLARVLVVGVTDRHQHILTSPSNAAFVEIVLSGSDTTSTYQSISYKYVSIRKIDKRGVGITSESVGYSQTVSRVKLPVTKSQFDANQYYFAPLPVGVEVEFAYAAAAARLAKVTAQATDNTGKLGTLQVIANYP